jgi:AbrB family looped-hinge helix DNA binding protein
MVTPMPTTTMSSKGQIVLPSSLRSAHDWRPGTEFEIEAVAEGVLLKPVKPSSPFAPTNIDEVFGVARYSGPKLSLDDMHKALEDEARRRK